jgi:hypothetical protein
MSLDNTLLPLFCSAYNASANVESMVLLLSYFLKYVCSNQYGCFLHFLDIVLSRYVAQVFSECFWDGSSCPS